MCLRCWFSHSVANNSRIFQCSYCKIEVVQSWQRLCYSDMRQRNKTISNHHYHKEGQTGADAGSAATWTTLWSDYAARIQLALQLQMFFMRYVLTDMCCQSASSTAATSLEMTLNSAHQITERLLIANTSCINMVTWEGLSERSFLHVWCGRFEITILHLIITTQDIKNIDKFIIIIIEIQTSFCQQLWQYLVVEHMQWLAEFQQGYPSLL